MNQHDWPLPIISRKVEALPRWAASHNGHGGTNVQWRISTKPGARLFIINVNRGTNRRFGCRRWFGTTDIDGSGIKSAFDVRGVAFLDHLDASAAVFGDLEDVGTLHQPHADTSVAQTVSRARLLIAVALELCTVQDAVE